MRPMGPHFVVRFILFILPWIWTWHSANHHETMGRCARKKKTYTGVYWLVVQTCSNIFYFPFHIWDVILPIDFHSYISNMVKTSKQYILRRTDVEWNFCAWASCVGKWDWSWSIPPTLPVGPNPWPIWPFIPRMVQYTQRERGWGSIVLGKL